MEESEKGDKGQVYMFYNKPFTIEEDIYVVNFISYSSYIIHNSSSSVIYAKENSTQPPVSYLLRNSMNGTTFALPASTTWKDSTSATATMSGPT